MKTFKKTVALSAMVLSLLSTTEGVMATTNFPEVIYVENKPSQTITTHTVSENTVDENGASIQKNTAVIEDQKVFKATFWQKYRATLELAAILGMGFLTLASLLAIFVALLVSGGEGMGKAFR